MSVTILGTYGPAQPETSAALTDNQQQSGMLVLDCNTAENLLTNCGFETGDFTGWVTQDLTSPFFALQVAGPTNIGYGFFTSAPTEGVVSALTGFDGDGPGTIEVGQDVTIPPNGNVTLMFDYRAAWDMDTFSDGAAARTFSVDIEPMGGGAPMESNVLLTAEGDTVNLDTGILAGNIDLSAFSGQGIRVNFVWNVPENFTGPAFFELDNVSLISEPVARPVPASDDIGVMILVGLLAAGAWTFLRKIS